MDHACKLAELRKHQGMSYRVHLIYRPISLLSYKFAYVLVTYHKMGHALSNQLVEHIQRGIESHHNSKMKQNFQRLERRYVNARDDFSSDTKV